MILAIKTDSPDVEIRLYDSSEDEIKTVKWTAGRELSQQLLKSVMDICDPNDLKSIIIFEGPGSYTGLRIGFSVANALGYSLNIPVVGAGSDDWISLGHSKLDDLDKVNMLSFKSIAPDYGGAVYTTKPKK